MAVIALAAFTALLYTGTTAEAQAEDSLCKEGYHYAYEAVYVYETGEGRVQHHVDESTAGDLTKVGIEWRDYCLSDELVDTPISRGPGEGVVFRKGHRAYERHDLDELCATGDLSASQCTALEDARDAAMSRHPELGPARQGRPQVDWSPPGGWSHYLDQEGLLPEPEPEPPYHDPENPCVAGVDGGTSYHSGPNGASCSGKASASGKRLYEVDDAESGAGGGQRFQDENGRIYECVELDKNGNTIEGRRDYEVTHYDRCNPV
ncbi:MAG: hypothetical protein F4X26_01945 [Chloroflexi bacterium]|nr:hypothetical protein [Chloroflexota bacterium]